MHVFMRMAHDCSLLLLTRELEHLREHCAAQLSFALVYSERKLGSAEQRREARERAARDL
jgi:hypothetical protein